MHILDHFLFEEALPLILHHLFHSLYLLVLHQIHGEASILNWFSLSFLLFEVHLLLFPQPLFFVLIIHHPLSNKQFQITCVLLTSMNFWSFFDFKSAICYALWLASLIFLMARLCSNSSSLTLFLKLNTSFSILLDYYQCKNKLTVPFASWPVPIRSRCLGCYCYSVNRCFHLRSRYYSPRKSSKSFRVNGRNYFGEKMTNSLDLRGCQASPYSKEKMLKVLKLAAEHAHSKLTLSKWLTESDHFANNQKSRMLQDWHLDY